MVILVDGVQHVTRQGTYSYLSAENETVLLQGWRAPGEQPELSRLVSLYEIEQHGFSLHLPLYIRGSEGAEAISPEVAIERWQDGRAALRASYADLLAVLQENRASN